VKPASQSFTGTVVAIVSQQTKQDAAHVLSELSTTAVRTVLISLGDRRDAAPRDEEGAIVIEGLVPQYLNNAVASLRLSSLPTLAWWRAGDPRMLPEVAALVDRLVIDVEDPATCWPMIPAIAPLASVSELRWARLTRWRDLIAQFFDMPDVRASADGFDRLGIVAGDRHDARLVAGWLKARLPGGERLRLDLRGGAAPLDAVALSGSAGSLTVRLVGNHRCLETEVRLGSGQPSTRVVALGDQRPLTLLREEVRVRSRDLAYEEAAAAAEKL
jgi:glucose-6-phosphate dehydrogenase assembly protein OpcA